jgi:hypothetical protein
LKTGIIHRPSICAGLPKQRGVAVQPLLEKGFKGQELGEAIKRERLKALKAYKEAIRTESIASGSLPQWKVDFAVASEPAAATQF